MFNTTSWSDDKMKIEVLAPFLGLWKKAYLRKVIKGKSAGRKIVDLFNSNKDRTSISYARWLMCIKVGYIISANYEIDHIDRNNSNDDITNLQILTKEKHRLKTSKENSTGRTGDWLTCEVCGKLFFKAKYNQRAKKRIICGRKCNGKLSSANLMQQIIISDNDIEKIREYRLLKYSDYKIAKLMSIERSKIWRIRKKYNIK